MAKKQGKDRLTWRGWAAAAALLLLLAVGVGVWCWRGGDATKRVPPAAGGADATKRVPSGTDADATKRVPSGTDADATKRVPPGAGARMDATKRVPPGVDGRTDATKRVPPAPAFVKRPGALQLPDGRVLTFPPPKEGEVRKVYSHGHLYECDHEGNFTEVTKRQLFKTAFEANFLGLAVADKPFIPAFLTGLDEADVRAALRKPYEPKGDETEEELAQLKAYDEMRAIALQYMDGGGSFDDFVEAFAKQVKEERAANAACLREVMTLYRQGRLDEAKAAAESADALKRENGLAPLRLPPHVAEALGRGGG